MIKLLSLSLLVACTHAAPVNFAATAGQLADRNAQCLALHSHVGPDQADSAFCGMSDGSVTFISVSAKDMTIKPFLHPTPKSAPEAPPAPAAPTPESAPSKSAPSKDTPAP